MSNPKTLTAIALLTALLGLGLGLVNFFGGRDQPESDGIGAAPDPADPDRRDPAIAELRRRLDSLEQGRDSRGPAAASGDSTAPHRTPIRVDPAAFARLEARVSKLERARSSSEQATKGLADPKSIPAALAVLLASRGVVTEIGDIEAIQRNYAVLADLVRDPRAAAWSRLEAYRGLLMFGGGEEYAKATVGDLASIVASQADAKVRRSAAAAMATHMDPSTAPTLIGAYYREQDTAVRREIVSRLLQCLDDPRVQKTLAAAVKAEADPAIKARIDRALARQARRR